MSLLSPPLLLLHSFSSTVATKSTVSRISTTPSKLRFSVVNAMPKNGNSDDEDPSFNPFGFVTDNPSSRSAIQLPESPAEDGNVGQMLYRTEDKGKEYGSTIKSGKLRWFVRETDQRRVVEEQLSLFMEIQLSLLVTELSCLRCQMLDFIALHLTV